MYVELIGRAQMTDTDETQGAPGSVFIARPLHPKKRSEWYYHLRQLERSQRQGRGSAGRKAGWHGRHGPRRGPRSAGGGHSGRNQAGFPGPVSTDTDLGQSQAGFPAPISADSDFQQRTLGDLSRALAILQGVHDAMIGPAGASPP